MNKQQELWQGQFGNEYHVRNVETNRTAFWYNALRGIIHDFGSVLEVGAGKGDNLEAIRAWNGKARVTGIDINESACKVMAERGIVAIHGPFPQVKVDNRYDLVMTRGFLIHVPQVYLKETLERIYELSNRYICVAEYYSPNRRKVNYRNITNAMWTGDYAGMLMKLHPDLRLVNYGFSYWQDGGNDVTWFLMEKMA